MFKEFHDYAEVYTEAKKTINKVQSEYKDKLNKAIESYSFDGILLYSKRIEICWMLKGIISNSEYWKKSYILIFALTSKKLVEKFVRECELILSLKSGVVDGHSDGYALPFKIDTLLSKCIDKMMHIIPESLKGIEYIIIDDETDLMLWDTFAPVEKLPEGINLKRVTIKGQIFEYLDIPYNERIIEKML